MQNLKAQAPHWIQWQRTRDKRADVRKPARETLRFLLSLAQHHLIDLEQSQLHHRFLGATCAALNGSLRWRNDSLSLVSPIPGGDAPCREVELLLSCGLGWRKPLYARGRRLVS